MIHPEASSVFRDRWVFCYVSMGMLTLTVCAVLYGATVPAIGGAWLTWVFAGAFGRASGQWELLNLDRKPTKLSSVPDYEDPA